MYTISTARAGLVLRQFRLSDAEELHTLVDHNREHVSQWGEPTSRMFADLETTRRTLQYPSSLHFLHFGVWSDYQLAGAVLAGPDPDLPNVMHIGYWVGKEYCGHGIATEAVRAVSKRFFVRLQTKCVLAKTHLHNRASQAVLLKAGFSVLYVEDYMRFIRYAPISAW